MSYITWRDLTNRYNNVATLGGAKEVSSAHIFYAENEINGLLGDKFTVPFSSNNLTAVDLAVELAYARIGVVNIKDSDMIRKNVMMRVKNIKEGNEQMMLSDGTFLTTTGQPVYSSDKNYHHTFGVGGINDMFVDSSQIYDEQQERDPF